MNQNKLKFKWDKRYNDYIIDYPRKVDGHLLNEFFQMENSSGLNIIQELENRGYDLTTLKFEVSRKNDT